MLCVSQTDPCLSTCCICQLWGDRWGSQSFTMVWFWWKQSPLKCPSKSSSHTFYNAVFGHFIDLLCFSLSGAVHGAETLKTPTVNLRIIAHRIHPLSAARCAFGDLTTWRSRIGFIAFVPSFTLLFPLTMLQMILRQEENSPPQKHKSASVSVFRLQARFTNNTYLLLHCTESSTLRKEQW